ncbi:MAG: hypothetical protein RIQ81_751 [Pseudomonadota bacterium]|jgi:hypothetical protein
MGFGSEILMGHHRRYRQRAARMLGEFGLSANFPRYLKEVRILSAPGLLNELISGAYGHPLKLRFRSPCQCR